VRLSDVDLFTHKARSRYASPWSMKQRIRMLAWEACWFTLCRWTPKPFYKWRLFWLRIFGCKVLGEPFVHQRARIQIPWHVTLHDRSCVGDRANLYSLGEIEIGERATIGQETYLCTGTHDFDDAAMPLQTAKITIEADVFLGARTFVLPGICVGEGAVVGACSLVTRNVTPWSVWAGSPARFQRKRSPPT
jgi:putative colanic acid biosynthesis acetyltransferase WcaF